MSTIDPSIQKRIVDFVQLRVERIRTGERALIESTYSKLCLAARNQCTRHDYDWYMQLIENGFDVDLRKIEIVQSGSSQPLPFAGMVTYPWPPPPFYKVFLTTVTDRKTMWLVGFDEDEPEIVLPRFNGRVADSIATGEALPWRLAEAVEANSESTAVVRFHQDYFSDRLAERVAHELDFWSNRWKFETIRALALDCAPWHGSIGLCLLTTKEEFLEDEFGKWALGDWRLQDFTSSTGAGGWPAVKDLGQLMQQYYAGKTTTDKDGTLLERADVIFRCCARALASEKVASSLARYDLTDDFELGVFDPDHPGSNYCQGG